jgi:hypothetical protein
MTRDKSLSYADLYSPTRPKQNHGYDIIIICTYIKEMYSLDNTFSRFI